MTHGSHEHVYPVLPLQHAVLFPHIVMPFAVDRPQSVAAIEAVQTLKDTHVIVAVQRHPEPPHELDDLYPTATLAVVTRVVQRQENVLQMEFVFVDCFRDVVHAAIPALEPTYFTEITV